MPEKTRFMCACFRLVLHICTIAAMQVQVQVGDTRRVFSMPQLNSYAELYDAIKKRFPKPDL